MITDADTVYSAKITQLENINVSYKNFINTSIKETVTKNETVISCNYDITIKYFF